MFERTNGESALAPRSEAEPLNRQPLR